MTEKAEKAYKFYGWEHATVPAVTGEYPGIHTPQDLYAALSEIWCAAFSDPAETITAIMW